MLATTEPDLIIIPMPTGSVLGWAVTGFSNLAVLRMRPATPTVATSITPAECVAWLVAAVEIVATGLMVVGRVTLGRRASNGSPSLAPETVSRAGVAGK